MNFSYVMYVWKINFDLFVMQSFLDPFEPKEESAEVKVFNLNHISGVQVEMIF